MEVRLSDSDLDRASRSSFIGEPGNISSSYDYKYYYYSDSDSDYCTTSTGQEWLAILILCGLILGLITSIVYLIVTVRHFDTLASRFLFLNNFVLASSINLLSGGIFDIMTLMSYCWYGGKVLCKVLPTILDVSDNAMVYFFVATVLEQNRPYVHSFLSKNTKFRKWTTITILWLVAMLFSVPEVIMWDTIELGGYSFSCSLKVSHLLNNLLYVIKVSVFDCLLQLVLLALTLKRAPAVSSRRLGPPATNQAPEEIHLRNGENDLQEETESQCPYAQIRVTSFAFALTKSFYYISYSIYEYPFLEVLSNYLFTFSLILRAIPSIVAAGLVLLISPIHKKRLKETYQFIVSCNAVRRRSLTSEENEDELQEVGVELQDQ